MAFKLTRHKRNIFNAYLYDCKTVFSPSHFIILRHYLYNTGDNNNIPDIGIKS